MRAPLMAALVALGASAASAQTRVPANRLAGIQKYFDARPGEPRLRCEVAPLKPSLGFTFRFQAGYEMRVPLSQYTGEGHRWTVAVRVTPEGGLPVYLVQRFRLPKIPETRLFAEVGGGYLVGEGRYSVAWIMLDDAGRVYRKNWRMEARLGRGERSVKVAIPPGTVSQFSLGVRPYSAVTDAPPLRLTILLDAAPLSPGRTRLRAADLFLSIATLSSLLEQLPSRSVKLVVFNLDQQKELFRQDGFTPAELDRVWQSMSGLELGVVDYGTLRNRRGAVDLLEGLVDDELSARTPSDAVVFLGPPVRSQDPLPREGTKIPQAPAPRFYYLQYSPFLFGWSRTVSGQIRMMETTGDTIGRMVSRLQGRTLSIRTPGDLAKAIEQVERR
jgi:hypothetical protein